MNYIRILVALAGAFTIFKATLHIVWLYYPSAFRGTFLYRLNSLSKFERLTYFLAGIICMGYYIFYVYEKIFSS